MHCFKILVFSLITFFTTSAIAITTEQVGKLLLAEISSDSLSRSFPAAVILNLFTNTEGLPYSGLTDDVFNKLLQKDNLDEIESSTGASKTAISIITRYISIYSISINTPLPTLSYDDAVSLSPHPGVVIPLLSTLGQDAIDRYIQARLEANKDKGLALSLMRFGYYFGNPLANTLMQDYLINAVTAEEENEIYINRSLMAIAQNDQASTARNMARIYLDGYKWPALLAALRMYVISGDLKSAGYIVNSIPLNDIQAITTEDIFIELSAWILALGPSDTPSKKPNIITKSTI